MKIEHQSATLEPDSAAIFAMALSLWEICEKRWRETNFNMSDCYDGMDQFMREVMRIANQFELWSCRHINFDELSDVWPYYLEDNFGRTCLEILSLDSLMKFDETDCLRAAVNLRLPVMLNGKLPIPIDLTAPNPISNSAFGRFRIQTVRNSIEDGDVVPFTADDDPFDECFGERYFGLYGIDKDGLLEHIADRKSYAEALELMQKLAPGIEFPKEPTFTSKLSAPK